MGSLPTYALTRAVLVVMPLVEAVDLDGAQSKPAYNRNHQRVAERGRITTRWIA